MDERDEAYVVTLTIGATVDVLSCALSTLALDAAAVAQWRALGSGPGSTPGPLLSVEVVQMGAAGPSPPLLFSVVL